MKTSFLVIGLGLALAACGGTTDNSSGSGGGTTTGTNQGGAATTGTTSTGGSGVGGTGSVGGSSVGGSSVGGSGVGASGVGGAGGSSCSNVPAPVGQLECGGGSSAVSSGSGPIACATSCIDQADNAYEVFCQGNECECHYYEASSGTSQGTSVSSSASGPSSTGSGGEDPSLICTCTVSSNDACASQQHCCPAPWQ
jgi:hypothetical protein